MSHNIETIELTIEQAKKSIDLMKRMERLYKNRDFKAIFEDDYFDNYTRNTVYLLSDPNMQGEAEQADLLKDLEAIGRVRTYLGSIFQKGRLAEKTLKDSEVTLEELRAEGEED